MCEMNRQIKGALWVVAAMLSFSLMSTLVKLAGTEVSSTQSVFVRGVVGVIWVYIAAKRRKVDLRGNQPFCV